MFNKPYDAPAMSLVEFTTFLFKTLARRYGGDTTLNEVRVINQIILGHLNGQSCSVTALHKLTGIPIPTVSRCVANLLRDNWASERQDPDDGRKRIVSLGPRFLDLGDDDFAAAMCKIGDFSEHSLVS